MMRRRMVVVSMALAGLLAGCGALASSPLTVRFSNTGERSLTGFYTQPVGVLPSDGWETADWGDNLLPVTTLQKNQYVIFPDFPREDLDIVATYEGTELPTAVKWNVPAQWIPDAEHLRISAGRDLDGSGGQGHNFGFVDAPDEVDVTP